MTAGRQLTVILDKPLSHLRMRVWGSFQIFCSPEREAPVFPPGPCPLPRMGMPGPKSRVRLQQPPLRRTPSLVQAAAAAAQDPASAFWDADGSHVCRPGRRASLTCSAAWRIPAAHLPRILEHPFFGATAASAVTSPEAGPTPPRDALGARRGGGAGRGRPWKSPEVRSRSPPPAPASPPGSLLGVRGLPGLSPTAGNKRHTEGETRMIIGSKRVIGFPES